MSRSPERSEGDEAISQKGWNYCERLPRFPFALLWALAHRNDKREFAPTNPQPLACPKQGRCPVLYAPPDTCPSYHYLHQKPIKPFLYYRSLWCSKILSHRSRGINTVPARGGCRGDIVDVCLARISGGISNGTTSGNVMTIEYESRLVGS